MAIKSHSRARGNDCGPAPKKAHKKPVSYAQHKWDTLWKSLLTTNGRIDKAKLMIELADYSILMEEAGKVYEYVTGGRVNTVRTMSADVINAAVEADNETLGEILTDEKEQWEQDRGARDPVVERLENVCYVRLGSPTASFEGRHIHITIPGGTYSAAWCSTTEQLFLDTASPLPADWVDTTKEAAKALLSKEQ